jgi:hypothetical protein
MDTLSYIKSAKSWNRGDPDKIFSMRVTADVKQLDV